MNKKILLVAFLLVTIATAVAASIVYYYFQSTGRITKLQVTVYLDKALTQALDISHPLDWGDLVVPSTVNRTVFIKNTGTRNVTAMALLTQDWDPSNMTGQILLNWNYTGAVLMPGQVITVRLDMLIPPSCPQVDYFRFNIAIAVQG